MAQFIASNQELNWGGTPLSLSVYDESIIETLNESPSIKYTRRVYGINIIKKTHMHQAVDTEISFVWQGTRFATTQDSADGKIYLNIIIAQQTSTPIKETIIRGMPIGIGANNELMFNDSEYLISDIERYSYIMIGGVPLTIGQINNKWYLVVYTV